MTGGVTWGRSRENADLETSPRALANISDWVECFGIPGLGSWSGQFRPKVGCLPPHKGSYLRAIENTEALGGRGDLITRAVGEVIPEFPFLCYFAGGLQLRSTGACRRGWCQRRTPAGCLVTKIWIWRRQCHGVAKRTSPHWVGLIFLSLADENVPEYSEAVHKCC